MVYCTFKADRNSDLTVLLVLPKWLILFLFPLKNTNCSCAPLLRFIYRILNENSNIHMLFALIIEGKY